MSRTYKRYQMGVFRKPKGHKNSIIHFTRHRAIVPHSWEDIPFDKQCWLPEKACYKMMDKGLPDEEIINRLSKKFNLRKKEALSVLEFCRL